MANLSSFFPAAATGGGGFTKMNKYSTARALDDATHNNAASYTVNPATDLGLEDGASIGYFMIGGGNRGEGDTSYINGGDGGKIIQGTAIITTASTNLTLTIGIGAKIVRSNHSTTVNTAATQSTISGGLTLTSADGTSIAGQKGVAGIYNHPTPSNGVNGYGGGGGPGTNTNSAVIGNIAHGFGFGGIGYNSNTANATGEGGDGAILLFY